MGINEEGVQFADTNHYNRSQNVNIRERLPNQDLKYHHNNIMRRQKEEQISMIRPATDNRFYSAKGDKISKTTVVPDKQSKFVLLE